VLFRSEAVPSEVARVITESTCLPVIGCVSGPFCDGQVVVLHDMLGYAAGHPPSNVKAYANLFEILTAAFAHYADDVKGGKFPTVETSIAMPEKEWSRLQRLLAEK